MFCFETALKALYWSILVYRYEQDAPDKTRDPVKVRFSLYQHKHFEELTRYGLLISITSGACHTYCLTSYWSLVQKLHTSPCNATKR